MQADLCTGLTLAVVDSTVVLVAEATDRPPIVAVMSARETHRIRSRLHKAANDASSAEHRTKLATA